MPAKLKNYVDNNAQFCWVYGGAWPLLGPSYSICLGSSAKSLFLGSYFAAGDPLGAFLAQTFSFHVPLHFYKLESLMGGVLPSGYLSYCASKESEVSLWWCVIWVLLTCNIKLATQLSVWNFHFSYLFYSRIGDPNKSSKKTDCIAGMKFHLSKKLVYYI